MRNFGGFIDDDEDDDQSAPPLVDQQHENSANISRESDVEDDCTLASPMAIQSDSINDHDQGGTAEAGGHQVGHNQAKAIVTPAKNHQRPAPHDPQQTPAAAPAAAPAKTYPTKSVAKNFKNGTAKQPPAKARARYAGHYEFNNLVRTDWQRAIEDDPYAYDGLVYLPEVATHPMPEAKHFESAVFTEINNNQRELTYSLPHPVVILDCPDERENFFTVDADGDQDGSADDFLVIRVAATGIPIGAVFEWNEEIMDGTTVPRWWYVMRIFSYGTASVGSLYFCVPARNFEGSQQPKVDRDAS